MPRAPLALLLLLTACGATDAPTAEPSGDDDHGGASSEGGSGGSSGSSDEPASAASRCPPRYGLAPPSCEPGDDPGRCVYPEGVCECAVPTWCGGAAPPPRPPMWSCRAPQPACASDGTACDREGARCAIGPCGWDSVVCTGGVWRTQIGPRPP